MAKERKMRDSKLNTLKYETEGLLTTDEEIMNKWRDYVDKLFIEYNESLFIKLDVSSGLFR
jgi:hypothetical protein